MKTKTILLIAICIIALISCGRKAENKSLESQMLSMPGSEIPPPPPPSNHEQYNPKLIKKGELTISAKDIELTKNLIYRFAKECNGYVTNENYTNTEYASSFDISLNVQASRFDLFLKKLDSSKINIVSRTFSVEDITMKYIDDSTRLFNKKKLEAKYLELITKTNDTKSLLEIEEKLEQIQSDIEVKQNQLKALDKQIAYSEFKITIEKNTSNLSYEKSNKFIYKLGRGLVNGWEGMKAIIIFLFSIWPFYVFVTLLYFVIQYIRRRRKLKKLSS